MLRPFRSIFLVACFATALAGAAGDQWSSYMIESTASAGGLTAAQIGLTEESLIEFGPSFKQLSVEVTPETASRLHVKIKPTGQQRWEVPESIVPRPGAVDNLSISDALYEVQDLDLEQPFSLAIFRRSDGSPIFNTTGHRFLFKDQYIELTTTIPEEADLYGLGEVTLPTGLLLPRDGTVITLWARDMSCANEYANLYGAHPFYLQTNRDGSSHGVLLLNSNGMDVTLDATSLTYKIIGGLVDLYFFMGPTPEEVIRQYHAVIGTPALPPYWSLGVHQSRWGYPNLDTLKSVVTNYTSADLPLEVIWSDIDYMHNRFRNAEFDPNRFPVDQMNSFVGELHDKGQHWIPIIDAGVAVSQGYSAYEEGSREKVWVLDHKGEPYVGQVWPGPSKFPDYLSSPNVGPWLERKVERFYQQVPWSGLWLDMNEAANFCSGTTCRADVQNATNMYWLDMQVPKDGNMSVLMKMLSSCVMKCDQPEPSNTLAFPPYNIHNFKEAGVRDAPLGQNVISPTARHANGVSEYDAHNLYGTAMSRSHYDAVLSVTGKRPFLVTRSTFPGAGRYAAHWTGDNAANWENLYYSIAGVINSNLWGIPMVGADICGFIDATQNGDPWTNPDRLSDEEYEQLCGRWASLGALAYPFSRNHMGYHARDHEFYRWPSVAAAAKKAYGLRYQLLTYLYSSLFLAHIKGGTVVKPLYFTAPADVGARNASEQVMLGEGVLVSPVVRPDTTAIEAYFTAGVWYSAWDYSPLVVSNDMGHSVSLEVPQGDIAVHYRGGTVLPLQQYAPMTKDIRYSPVTLVIALPSAAWDNASSKTLPPYITEEACRSAHEQNSGSLVSCGMLFMDSEADAPVDDGDSVQVWFTSVAAADAKSGSISSTVLFNNGEASGRLRITEVHILGVASAGADDKTSEEQPASKAHEGAGVVLPDMAVRLNGQGISTQSISFDALSGVLKISGLEQDVGDALDIQWGVPQLIEG